MDDTPEKENYECGVCETKYETWEEKSECQSSHYDPTREDKNETDVESKEDEIITHTRSNGKENLVDQWKQKRDY